MKKKIFAISGIFIGIGSLLLTAGVLGSGCKDNRTVRNTENVTESFTQISITVQAGDITVLPSADGSCRLDYRGTKKQYFSVSVAEGVLSVREVDTRKWYKYVGVFFGDLEAVLYVPDELYTTLSLEGGSGDIEVGQVRVDAFAASCESGSVELLGIQARTIAVQTKSGEIDVEGVTAGEGIRVQSESGDIEMTRVSSQGVVTVTSKSGEIDMEQVVSAGETKVTSSSGDVEFTSCDGASYDVQTASGSVTGSIKTPKTFQAESRSGKINVPKTGNGGIFKVKTKSGRISIVTF